MRVSEAVVTPDAGVKAAGAAQWSTRLMAREMGMTETRS
jgi:hypothetical protein